MITVNEIRVKDYVSKSKLPVAEHVINPYVGCPHKCIYCYAEFMRRFTGHSEEWGDFIDIKRCDKSLNIPKLAGSSLFIGSVTDPYNPYENNYQITRQILRQLLHSRVRVEILTKSSLVTRDIDLFLQIPRIKIGISMNSLDDSFRKQTEPGASSVENKLDALKALHAAGIQTYVFMSPMFPGITDFQAIIERTADRAEAFHFENLNLRAGYYSRVMHYIETHHPHLTKLYTEIYRKKNPTYWQELEEDIATYCTNNRLNWKSFFFHKKRNKSALQE